MNIFQKSAAGLPLSPTARAFLKLVQSIILTAIIAGLFAAGQYLQDNGQINWHMFAIAVGGASALAIAHAVAKYYTAQGDAALGTAIDMTADQAAKKLNIPPVSTTPATPVASPATNVPTPPTA